MTKLLVALTLGACALATPALAQHHGAQSTASNDPCVLGTNAQPGACVGPVRVAPVVVSEGPVARNQAAPVFQAPAVMTAPTFNQGPTQLQPIGYAQPQPTYQAPGLPTPVPAGGGCVGSFTMNAVGCNGNWVPAPAPQFVPAPAPAPAPVVTYAAPPQFVAPPQYVQAPVPGYAAMPQPIGYIPTSFFTGGITYGAGFPEGTYSYGGGGGFIISGGGGTRFSGVRERSPTALIPPPPRQRHNPPPAHRPPCCKH
jgi:hypothetical protein